MTEFLLTLTTYRWIGRSIMAVALIHTAFTFVIVPDLPAQIWAKGVLDSVTAHNAAGVWFFLFGLPLMLVGLLVDWGEKYDELPLPPLLLWGLTGLTVLGITLMPESGFYLMIPALAGLFAKNRIHEKCVCWSRRKPRKKSDKCSPKCPEKDQ